jgi:ferrous iron transport protein B
MARAAFVMDHSLSAIGLPGKAFIPMLVGFGCNVPGIMATRTLESRRDRILAILINPFMSCGARLPVYTLFAAAFFPQRGGMVIFGLYLIGIVLAVLSGLLFKKTILEGEATSFVMELPPYHLPTFSGVMFNTWSRLKSFILKAGQVILVIVTVLGFLNSLGTDGSFGNSDSQNSVLSAMGRAATPVFQPMGIEKENWPATVGLFTGILAKESVVGTLSSIYSQMEPQDGGVSEGDEPFDFWQGVIDAFAAIPAGFEGFFDQLKDPLGFSSALGQVEQGKRPAYSAMVSRFGEQGGKAAFAYLLFILIYAPCVAVLATIAREIGVRWMLFAVSYLTGLAWIISTLFFQFSTFALHPSTSAGWIGLCFLILAVCFGVLKKAGKRA